jgi:hypothetical protein
MANPIFPRAQASPLGNDGNFTPEWRRLFETLYAFVGSNSDLSSEIASILERLDELEDGDDATATIQGLVSVQVTGSLSSGVVQVQLQGDTGSPGNTYYYGTDSTGEKGWFERRLDTLVDVDFSTPPVAGDALVHNGTAWVPGSVDGAVPFFIPDGSTYTVAANKQALFALPIELEGTASLVVDGALVEVS